jgi:pyruvate, orthophosphate dikinase
VLCQVDQSIYNSITAEVVAAQQLAKQYTSFRTPSTATLSLHADSNSGGSSDEECTLAASSLREIVRRFRAVVSIPDDPLQQLHMAIAAAFASWNSPAANKYRHLNGLDRSSGGTAVTVQRMVFGNRNRHSSGSGLAFSRNPYSGLSAMYGEFLPGQLGEGQSEGSFGGERRAVELEEGIGRIDAGLSERLGGMLMLLERTFGDMQVT